MNTENKFYSLIPLDHFKALTGADDRDDGQSRWALQAATCAIEHFCKRRLLKKTRVDLAECSGDGIVVLRDYPVREIIEVKAGDRIVPPGWWETVPEVWTGEGEELWEGQYYLLFKKEARLGIGERIAVRYEAGFGYGEAPPDLGSACLELAWWMYARLKGKKMGVTGGRGERLEESMPGHVRELIKPYRMVCV